VRAPVVVRRHRVEPSNIPLTFPALARNSSMIPCWNFRNSTNCFSSDMWVETPGKSSARPPRARPGAPPAGHGREAITAARVIAGQGRAPVRALDGLPRPLRGPRNHPCRNRTWSSPPRGRDRGVLWLAYMDANRRLEVRGRLIARPGLTVDP